MEFPIELQLGSFSLPLHLIFETLAFIIGYRYYSYLRKETTDKISTTNRINIIIGAAAGALMGSRFLGAMEQPLQWLASDHFWLYLYKNKTIVGGFVGGWIGVEFIKKIIGVQQSSGDLFTFPMILALLIGRIGCFTMGVYEETYGVATSLPWAMNLGDDVLRHPVTLYEMSYLIVLWITLRWAQKKYVLKSGMIFRFFMMGYALYRLLQDFIKPVFTYEYIGLSSIQIVCIAVLLYYSKTILSLITQPQKLLHD